MKVLGSSLAAAGNDLTSTFYTVLREQGWCSSDRPCLPQMYSNPWKLPLGIFT